MERTPHERSRVVRIAEYSPYPRVSSEHRRQLGYTRDASPSGMCLGVETPEALGALLQVTVRQVDGAPSHETLARVIWCGPRTGGRFWIGLELIGAESGPMRFVRSQRSFRRRVAARG